MDAENNFAIIFAFYFFKINVLKTSFENIYDAYCPMLYNIALQICPDKSKAEKILLLVFKKLYHQDKGERMDKKPFCIDLIKLIIQTAREELYPGQTKFNFKIKQFEKTPLLHKILVEQLNLENYCIENGLSRQVAMLKLRGEFMLIRNNYEQYSMVVDASTCNLN